ncbi:MAG TPA: DUF3107 domain-containing protein [Acidimicrobiales bacterium]|nr:DUF3107 domain-containing protein [Acidimicrobiales bacterium]
MDVRIGVLHTPKEILVELDSAVDRDKLKATIDDALTDESKVLWLTDKKGRDVAIPVSKVAYVEVSSATAERPIGFGG